MALAVHDQYRLRKGLHDVRKNLDFAARGHEIGAEFASAPQLQQQRAEFTLVLRIECQLIEWPQCDEGADLFSAAECDSDQTVKSPQRAQPIPVKFRPDKFPIWNQFGTGEHIPRQQAALGVQPYVLSGKTDAIERSETLIDSCGVADFTLMCDEVVV